MSEFKGTKGEWEVVEHSWSDTSLMCGEKTICTQSIYDDATEENQEELESEVSSNFQLIAHAPQMLDILKQIDYTLSVHGKVNAGTNLHIRLAELIQQATTI